MKMKFTFQKIFLLAFFVFAKLAFAFSINSSKINFDKSYDTLARGFVQDMFFIHHQDTNLISLDVINIWYNAGYFFNYDPEFELDGNDLIVSMFFEGSEISIPVVTETRDTIDLPAEWLCNNNKLILNVLVFFSSDTTFSHYAVEVCLSTDTADEYVNDTNYIHPNPADNFIFVPGTETVAIFDNNLRPVKYIENISKDGFISVADLSPGIYLVRFRRDNIVRTEKLIISRL